MLVMPDGHDAAAVIEMPTVKQRLLTRSPS